MNKEETLNYLTSFTNLLPEDTQEDFVEALHQLNETHMKKGDIVRNPAGGHGEVKLEIHYPQFSDFYKTQNHSLSDLKVVGTVENNPDLLRDSE